jgi:hypothetical protein
MFVSLFPISDESKRVLTIFIVPFNTDYIILSIHEHEHERLFHSLII